MMEWAAIHSTGESLDRVSHGDHIKCGGHRSTCGREVLEDALSSLADRTAFKAENRFLLTVCDECEKEFMLKVALLLSFSAPRLSEEKKRSTWYLFLVMPYLSHNSLESWIVFELFEYLGAKVLDAPLMRIVRPEKSDHGL